MKFNKRNTVTKITTFINLKQKNIIYFIIPFFLLIINFCFINKVEAVDTVEFKQQIPIPGVATSTLQPNHSTKALGEYIKGIYNYGIGIVAILATAVMMFGGFQWIIAGGSAERVGEAKAWIGASLTGLVLALSSYTILNLINPNLTSLKIQKIETISKIDLGCCSNKLKTECTSTTDEKECSAIYKDGIFNMKATCTNNKCQSTLTNEECTGRIFKDIDTLSPSSQMACSNMCSSLNGVDTDKTIWFNGDLSLCCVCK